MSFTWTRSLIYFARFHGQSIVWWSVSHQQARRMKRLGWHQNGYCSSSQGQINFRIRRTNSSLRELRHIPGHVYSRAELWIDRLVLMINSTVPKTKQKKCRSFVMLLPKFEVKLAWNDIPKDLFVNTPTCWSGQHIFVVTAWDEKACSFEEPSTRVVGIDTKSFCSAFFEGRIGSLDWICLYIATTELCWAQRRWFPYYMSKSCVVECHSHRP